MINDNYNDQVNEQLSKAAQIRKEWAAKSEENKKLAETHKQQHDCGYYPKEMAKCNPCDTCGATQSEEKSVTSGCRNNGDAYGSLIVWCTNCGQCVHSMWDEN
jgi:hypothetical protein